MRTGRDIGSAIENAAFQVTTLISTTGYCTEDFDLWPQFCRCILVLVMFFGGCAGSTAGGVKASRIVLLCKALRRDLRRVMHSREVRPITLDGHRVTEETVSSVSVFFFAYIAIMLLGTLILSLDNIDFTARSPPRSRPSAMWVPALARWGRRVTSASSPASASS